MSNTKITSSLVSVQWLADHFDSENLVVLDASLQPVTAAGNEAEEEPACIKGARRFDFDKHICDQRWLMERMGVGIYRFTCCNGIVFHAHNKLSCVKVFRWMSALITINNENGKYNFINTITG